MLPLHTNRRVYDESRDLLGNYKTVAGKEKAPHRVIDGDPEECLVSGHFAESELMGGNAVRPI